MITHISQIGFRWHYASALGWPGHKEKDWSGDTIPNQFKRPQACFPWTANLFDRPGIDTVSWGFQPEDKSLPAVTEADIETASTARYLRHMWAQRRVIIPVEGWGQDGAQVWPKDGGICLLAAITNWIPYQVRSDGCGFVLIVDGAARRPIALSSIDANNWMDAAAPAEAVMRISRQGLPASQFAWK